MTQGNACNYSDLPQAPGVKDDVASMEDLIVVQWMQSMCKAITSVEKEPQNIMLK
jgi:hypothetical protein